MKKTLYNQYDDGQKIYSEEVYCKFLEDMRYGEDINNKVYDIIRAICEDKSAIKESTNLIDYIQKVADDFATEIAEEKKNRE